MDFSGGSNQQTALGAARVERPGGRRWWATIHVVLALVCWASTGLAGTIQGVAEPFTGSDAQVLVTLDDMVDPGSIVITLAVQEDPHTADLRGFFLDIASDGLIGGLSIAGDDVTQAVFSASNVINLGGGNNLNGGGSPCPCDIGVEIGLPGIGMGDDIQTTVFTLSHATEDLDLSLFYEQSFGVRVTSVGLPGGSREGSSKLGGMLPVPEPSTGLLVLSGLVFLAKRPSRVVEAS